MSHAIGSLSLSAFAALVATAGCVAGDDPSPPQSFADTAQAVINERNATITTGHTHSCAIEPDTTVSCWGRNNYGQLGDGTSVDSPAPVTVVGIDGAVAVTAGKYHSCAALLDGTARCWGLGTDGQLGNGSTANRLTPVTVTGLGAVTSLSAGGAHTCASLGNGQARCWGANSYGQLGNTTLTGATTPRVVGNVPSNWALVTPLINVAEIETGAFFTCARLTAGTVSCWGRNSNGQLGDGTTAQRSAPGAVSGINNAVDVAVGDTHACVATGLGRARCWGANLMGQLGDGSNGQRTTPVDLRRRLTPTETAPITTVSAVAAGQYHTCVRSSGDVWCVGRNDHGQLGIDVSPELELLARRTVPTVVATELAAGGDHTCARRPGGAIVCFGRDNYGQVGELGRCPAVPTATLVQVDSPGAGLVHKSDGRGEIYYTDGNDLEITVETTACARVSGVDYHGVALDGDDPVEVDELALYDIVSTVDRDDGVREIKVHVAFVNRGYGVTGPVAVHLSSLAGNPASASFTLAEVQGANPGHSGIVEIGQAELLNEVVQAMYDNFGDQNYWRRNGLQINFYDFDYDELGLTLTEQGVHFTATVKADLNPIDDDGPCDPTLQVSGKFKLVSSGDNIETEWVTGVNIQADWPTGCIAVGVPFVLIADVFIDVLKEQVVEKKVAKRVAALREYCDLEGLTDCDQLINEIRHEDFRVSVELSTGFESVTYLQPYSTGQLAAGSVGDPMRRGIALPPDQDILLVTGGIARGCSTQACEPGLYRFGPGGLFNWNWPRRQVLPTEDEAWGAYPPVLDPWPCNANGCGYFAGRHAAWLRILGMARDLDALPMPDRNVGSLLVRTLGDDGSASNLKYAGDYVCRLPVAGGEAARLVVGRNDRPGGPQSGEFGIGDALVTMVFIPAPLGPACPE